MKTTNRSAPSGIAMGGIVSIVGLVLVWSIVWANLPSRQELLSTQLETKGPVAPAPPELDLTIPGVSPPPRLGTSDRTGPAEGRGSGAPSAAKTTGASSVPSTVRARKIAEVKCDAVVQQMCPNSLSGEDRQRCVVKRMKQLSLPCQHVMRQRLVRWKEAEGYKVACLDEVTRFCQRVEPGDGRILSCLQVHEQDLSEGCYQSLPKGHLLLGN